MIANGGHRMAISSFGSQEAVDWRKKFLNGSVSKMRICPWGKVGA